MTNKNTDADVDFIRALAELLTENDLTELEVQRETGKDQKLSVRVSRAKQVVTQMQAPSYAPQTQSAPSAAPSAPVSPAAASEGGDPATHPGAVTSPMVGTIYMQAEPGSDAFVKVGDKVSEGQTLLIVEAMKTMNHIPSPRAGTVKRILVEDGSPVEYGAPLMIVE
ncbi:acetyl-CoA carboxylase biotin carboxyl carrier protein [Anianabacter salinae]|uniref:acetyl-CoA carboxylase biotin carboxyl carrier protein n=1 Tax=Anianabacter salinae TaxID=2851023 RepID=UPI00225DEEB8|nr:acetyl-CoA carboxylase biotin carboxyl carrier protein [Anianabacter salinae]MBV0912329.1 acetyl-CoA carboxylase biotin carboxyl carrier protein [Anianabacter salinae]